MDSANLYSFFDLDNNTQAQYACDLLGAAGIGAYHTGKTVHFQFGREFADRAARIILTALEYTGI